MQDAEAICRLKRGEIDGLETLVERYQVRAVRTAYLVVQDEALAEDVVQETFLRIFQRIRFLTKDALSNLISCAAWLTRPWIPSRS